MTVPTPQAPPHQAASTLAVNASALEWVAIVLVLLSPSLLIAAGVGVIRFGRRRRSRPARVAGWLLVAIGVPLLVIGAILLLFLTMHEPEDWFAM